MIPVFSKDEFIQQFIEKATRREKFRPEVVDSVRNIIEEVRTRGDEAVKEFMEKFDGYVPESLKVTDEERKVAWKKVSPEVIEALQKAARNIREFHRKQLQQSRIMDVSSEVVSGQIFRPIERVGLYVPGGTACYPSSVLMNGIPAALAGVKEIIMVTPVRNGEPIAPILIVAADIAGVTSIYKVGGAQAIAALTYGTETIPQVDKIVGPGNEYVAVAKSFVYGEVGIDMIAGPSEVAIIVDETANPTFIAADLLAQAEHDERARAFLFTTSKTVLEETLKEINRQLDILPRKDIAKQSLTKESGAVLVDQIDEAFQLANDIAPEHLEIQVENALGHLGKVQNAGSVFLGSYTPESVGDYFAGPNHVLPTAGTARFSSGLSVDDFLKKITFVQYTEQALKEASPYIERLANEEKLEGHARAVQVRFQPLK